MKSLYFLAQITGSDSGHVGLFLLPIWNFACESQQEYPQQGLGHHLWPTLVKMFLCRHFVFEKHWNLWEKLTKMNNGFKGFFVTLALDNVDFSTFCCCIHPTPPVPWGFIYRGRSGYLLFDDLVSQDCGFLEFRTIRNSFEMIPYNPSVLCGTSAPDLWPESGCNLKFILDVNPKSQDDQRE